MQLAPDITKNHQKLEGLKSMNRSQLLAIAQNVCNNQHCRREVEQKDELSSSVRADRWETDERDPRGENIDSTKGRG